jgi:integrase/recombinase XerD
MPTAGGNLYKRNGTWYARIEIRGREYRRSLRTGSRTEALKRLKTFQEQAQHIRFAGEERHTWKQAVVEWDRAAQKDSKPSTIKRYKVSLNQAGAVLDDLYVDEITKQTIRRIAGRTGVSNATLRRDLTAVSVVLRWCVGKGWREDNPAEAFDRKIVRERRDPIVLPDSGDIDRVVGVAPGNFARLIRFAQYTGMRLEEVVSLRRDQLRGSALQLTNTKSVPRAVPLDDRARRVLAATVPYIGSPYVFWHGDGERYHSATGLFRANVYKAITGKYPRKDNYSLRDIKGAAFRPFRFHDLRHWYAVDYLRRGGSIYVLSQILGHSSVKVTEIYLRYLTPDEQLVVKRVGAEAGAIPAGEP